MKNGYGIEGMAIMELLQIDCGNTHSEKLERNEAGNQWSRATEDGWVASSETNPHLVVFSDTKARSRRHSRC